MTSKKKTIIYIIVAVVFVGLFVFASLYIDSHSTQMKTMSNPIMNNSNTTVEQNMGVDFKDYGPAPEITGITNWINSQPLTIASLKGKVVLVDFWTFSCINCIRTLPYVTKWYDTYKNQGLVVLGIHTPEFDFEKDNNNVADAVKRFGINYPVAQDNNYGTWNAFDNQYWPAEYLIDQKGDIVYEHFGEGNYQTTEDAVRSLIGLSAPAAMAPEADLSQVDSPEMYFEPSRLKYLDTTQTPSEDEVNYTLPNQLDLNTFALGGYWKFVEDGAVSTKAGASIELKFHSANAYMVASGTNPVTLHITVDGVVQPDVVVSGSQLYTLFSSNKYVDHIIKIDITAPGFEAFTLTFG